MFETLGLGPEKIAIPETMLRMLVSTAILFLAIILVRAVTARIIRKALPAGELRRRWLVQSRNALILLLIFGLIFVWEAELRTLALSIVAVAIAFVVATKELILCVTGSILKTGARSRPPPRVRFT